MFEADAFEFSIHNLSEQGSIVLSGHLGSIPHHPEGLFRLMLEAQHCFRETEGTTFSIDSERDYLSLHRIIPCAGLDGDIFFNVVERFVNQLEAWTRIICDYNGQAVSPQVQNVPLDHFHMMV